MRVQLERKSEPKSTGPRQPSNRKLKSTHLSFLAGVAILHYCRNRAKEAEPTVRKLLEKIQEEMPIM